jgi:hypothetical protein
MIYRMGDNPSDNDANLQQGNLFNGGTASRISLIHYSAGWQVCTGATDLVNGRRYWAAGTFSGTNGSVVYLNGVADGTDGNTTRGGVPSTHAAIGANAVTDQYYLNGSIESVLLYNRALTAGECLSLYKEMMQDNPFRWNWINNSLVRNVGAALKSRGLLSGGNLLGQGMLSGGRL